jgi:hypothetical protein
MSTAPDYDVEMPDEHGYVLTGDSFRHGHHLPMFHTPQHHYQVVFRFEFSEAVRDFIMKDRTGHPTAAYALVNTGGMLVGPIAKDKLPFNAYLYRVTPGRDGIASFESVGWSFRAGVTDVLNFRRFNPGDRYPEQLTYVLYGKEGEFALAHRPTKAEDFDQVVELKGLPSGLTEEQLAKTALTVRFPDLPERAGGGHYKANPLTADSYAAEAETSPGIWERITIEIKSAPWFDTHFINSPMPGAYLGGEADVADPEVLAGAPS